MPGAEFVRVDLHVHTLSDEAGATQRPLSEFIAAAVAADIRILAVTDHNRVDKVRDALEAAEGTDLLVLPGIEVTTHEGHLLALFDPGALSSLDEFATNGVLQFEEDPRDGSRRSRRSILELVHEIDTRGGLAIPAHIDAKDGLVERLNSTALASLLSTPCLAGLEFTRVEALQEWFTAQDTDPARSAALTARLAVPDLRDRGLARIMSSDAHSPDKVGLDRSDRLLTRLRLDDLNFTAVRNALVFGPRARCKAEQTLPPSYPRLLRARFTGGFLDGVALDFSANLTCFIGGRGSGKSTALLAARAALGASLDASEDDPDDPDRMPDSTEVDFIDDVGTTRTAVRTRGNAPHEKDSDAPIGLTLQGLAQDESGRLARGYRADPEAILRFLDQFVDFRDEAATEQAVLAALLENGTDVRRTEVTAKALSAAQNVVRQLEANFKAAQSSRLEDVAKWARWLASEGPLLRNLQEQLAAVQQVRQPPKVDLDRLAASAGVDLADPRARKFTEGAAGALREELSALESEYGAAGLAWKERVAAAAASALATVARWQDEHSQLQRRLDDKRKELAGQGLSVELGAVARMARDLERRRSELTALQERHAQHQVAQVARTKLLDDLHAAREARFERRKAALRRVVQAANNSADGLRIHLTHGRAAIRRDWEAWLGANFRFRTPRVERVAKTVTPRAMAGFILRDGAGLSEITGRDGEAFFDAPLVEQVIPEVKNWGTIFHLETMCLEDRVQIEVQEPGSSLNRRFAHLSAGQQRSVLLSIILCAERNDPLVLDQPEDHLDAPYIATALVGHLEAAKERRQVIVATHSPNLTVLGDAELVIPMYADAGHGAPKDAGAVDRPETRDRVCELLEGGVDAFRRRAQRYGLHISRG